MIMICLNFDMYRSGSYFHIDIHVIRKFLFIAHVNILGPGRLSTVSLDKLTLLPGILVKTATPQNGHTQNGHNTFGYQNGHNQNGHTVLVKTAT